MKNFIFFLIIAVPAGSIVFAQNDFLLFICGTTLINMCWATGLNLLYGYTGLIPFVFAGMAGISGYVTVYLVMSLHLPFVVAVPLGARAASAVGGVLSLPAIRLRGFYFALSGMVIMSAISIAFVYFTSLTNGDTGITSIPRPDFFGIAIPSPWIEWLLGLLVVVTVLAIRCTVKSRFGETLLLIREDEDLARAIGIGVTLNRMIAFSISSFIAGVGGSIYAHYVGFASPRSYDVLISLNVWLMVALGGRGTLVGPLLGALLLAPLPFFLQQYTWIKDVIYGSAIIAVTMFLPQGIYGYILSRKANLNHE
jgi:branched-chain amino acid transport system permease protein